MMKKKIEEEQLRMETTSDVPYGSISYDEEESARGEGEGVHPKMCLA